MSSYWSCEHTALATVASLLIGLIDAGSKRVLEFFFNIEALLLLVIVVLEPGLLVVVSQILKYRMLEKVRDTWSLSRLFFQALDYEILILCVLIF